MHNYTGAWVPIFQTCGRICHAFLTPKDVGSRRAPQTEQSFSVAKSGGALPTRRHVAGRVIGDDAKLLNPWTLS